MTPTDASADGNRSPNAVEQPAPGGERGEIRDALWWIACVTQDQSEARAEAIARAHFVNTMQSAQESGDVLRGEDGHFHVLLEMCEHPERYGVLMAEHGEITRYWDLLTRVNAHFMSTSISQEDKERIGRTFLSSVCKLYAAPGAEPPIGGVVDVALEVARHVAAMEEAREIRRIAGDSFTEAQAVAVARSLRGLARGQRRVEQLARSLYQQKDLNPAESKVAADAFVKAVSDKKAVLARILTPVQLERLYQEASYDSAAYWQRRIVGG